MRGRSLSLLLCVLALAGCGGDDDAATTTIEPAGIPDSTAARDEDVVSTTETSWPSAWSAAASRTS